MQLSWSIISRWSKSWGDKLSWSFMSFSAFNVIFKLETEIYKQWKKEWKYLPRPITAGPVEAVSEGRSMTSCWHRGRGGQRPDMCRSGQTESSQSWPQQNWRLPACLIWIQMRDDIVLLSTINSLKGNSIIMLEGLVITSGWDSLPISLFQIIFIELYCIGISEDTHSVSSLSPSDLATGDWLV